MPKISIITVSYNSGKTIADTLESVAKQTFKDVEHIIVDGASKDDTLDIVRSFNHIAKVRSEPDRGIYDAMNKGLEMASGEIIGFLNSDDMYAHEGVLEQIAKTFEFKNVDTVYSDLHFFKNSTDNIVRVWKAGATNRQRFLGGWMPPHPTFFAKKSVYDRFGVFDAAFKQSGDYELMLRFLYKHGVSTHYMQGVSILMRAGGQTGATVKNRVRANKEDAFAWDKNGLKRYWYTLYLKPMLKIEQLRFFYRKWRAVRQRFFEKPFQQNAAQNSVEDAVQTQNVTK
ncbi:MAG: glycosyltransferase [Saprospiraceae bacterium]|nr:glycosyltransferase [Saprospiraceae bacterium]